jgi:valyl-tRNA synthetase|tara:strand:- start:462 stop:2798 length:2337 start_codon:yes stop_codon:yes gene_type:complete
MQSKKKYNVKETEEKIKEFWEKNKIYKTNLKAKKIYSIDTPPPTVSGKMHIGHVFQYSQQDFITRFRRMNQEVFCPFGTDDNGLPTERLVEKLNNVKSKEMPRADFIELCLKTLKKITPEFIQDWKNIGISADYDISYSTIDKNSQKLSQKSFIDLFKAGEVYKKDFPTIWCPECQTTIAQAELEDKENSTLFSTIKFKSDRKDLLIATTRPELIGACVAVFINPNDKRYKNLIGKKAKIPLFEYEVPIIADKSADIEKGTGVLMICSYGDKFDVDAINRHKLKPRLILNKNGTLNISGYNRLRIKEARKRILNDLKEKGLIKESKQIEHVVNVHDKCGTEIEFLPTEQWFIKMLDKKKALIKQGEKINWYPQFMFKRFKNWIEGLEWDWSISRDRHFGIPIPVWHCKKCNEIILPLEKELPVDPIQIKKICSKCKTEAEPEKKVLDTWATSSLTPQICSSLIKNKVKIPFSLRNNASDIIRTWDVYTVTKSYLHEKEIPWKDMMVSGFVTLKGEKMSKSKGNTIEPQAIMGKFGADALRFWAAGSKLGSDLDYQEKDVVTGKKFITKIFNASKFVFMNLKDYNGKKPKKLERLDEEFLKHLEHLVRNVTGSFERYNYSIAKSKTEQFFWHDFADNYIEIVKKRIYQNKKGKESAKYTLYKSLLTILKLISPIMPFITEEIYQTYFKKTEKDKSIHISRWPEFGKDTQPSGYFTMFCAYLASIRQAKTKNKKSMNAEIILTFDKKYKKVLEREEMLEDFKDVTNSKEIKEGKFRVEFV